MRVRAERKGVRCSQFARLRRVERVAATAESQGCPANREVTSKTRKMELIRIIQLRRSSVV
jgi:hypothetical protein